MARVALRIDDFEDGVVPGVCVVTGEPATRLYSFRLSRTPRWIFLSLLLGPLGIIVLIVLAFTARREVSGFLPLSDTVVARGRRWRRCGWAVLGAALALLCFFVYVYDSFGGRDVLAVAGAVALVLILVGLWLIASPPGSVGGRPESDGRWVIVYPASTEFVAAYDAQEARRVAARRRAAGVDDPAGPTRAASRRTP